METVEIDPRTATQAVPLHMQLIQMAMGYWVSRILFCAAKLELADRLAAGPRSAKELAPETDTHAPALHRLIGFYGASHFAGAASNIVLWPSEQK